MAFLKTTIMLISGFGLYGAYSVFRLGKDLPKATRAMGNRLGMSYNYIKIILTTMSPESAHTGEIMGLYRQTSQMTTVFAREFKQNMSDINREYKKLAPNELIENPYEKFRMKDDNPIDLLPQDQLTGSQLAKTTMEERRRLRIKKSQKEATENKLSS